MINKIWAFFIMIGILYSVLTGNLSLINEEVIKSAKAALDMFLVILPLISLWVGIMAIAKESGLLDKLVNLLTPLLSFLFPEVPKKHESLSYIASNLIATLFGLGNAATPFGLKAMESLQTLNKKKDTASRSMITFLVLNTSSITIIPTTLISLRVMHKSYNPTDIIPAIIIATFISAIIALLIDHLISNMKRG